MIEVYHTNPAIWPQSWLAQNHKVWTNPQNHSVGHVYKYLLLHIPLVQMHLSV